MKLGAVKGFIFLLASVSHGTTKYCPLKIRAQANEILSVPFVEIPALPNLPGVAMFQLGKGNTGTVYSIVSPTESYPLKIYHDIKRGYDRETGGWREWIKADFTRDMDYRLMNVYRADALQGQDLGFYIPETQATKVGNDPALKFETGFAGRDVYSIVTDPKTPPEFRQFVLDGYSARLARFQQYLQTTHRGELDVASMKSRRESPAPSKYHVPFLEMKLDIRTPSQSMWTSIHFCADGVVVDKDSLEFILVDPN